MRIWVTGLCGISSLGILLSKRGMDPRLNWRRKTVRGPGGSQLPGTQCDPSPAARQALVSKACGPPCHSSSSIPRVQLLVEWGLKALWGRLAWRAGNNAPTGVSETIQFRPRKDFYPAPNFPLIDPEGKKKDLDNCIQIHLPKPFQTWRQVPFAKDLPYLPPRGQSLKLWHERLRQEGQTRDKEALSYLPPQIIQGPLLW